jgi:DNA primase
MKLDEARELLDKIGGKQSTVSSYGWLRAGCPFAPWTHAKGTDSKPSFAVNANEDGISGYKCYGCGLHGTMLTFLHRYERISGKKFPELHAFVQRTNQRSLESLERDVAALSYTKPKKAASVDSAYSPAKVEGALFARQQEMFEPVYLPEMTLSLLEPLTGEQLEYVQTKRRLESLTIQAWELLWNPETSRIAIPIRDEKMRLVGLSGRSFYEWQKPKYLHSKGFKRDYYLYGEHLLTERTEESPKRVGYLVEGFFDVIKLWQYGYDNVLAMMGSYLSSAQEQRLVSNFDSVVIVPDGDKPGYEASERIQAQLKKRLRCTITPMPVGYDPDDLTPAMAETLLGPPVRC